MSGVSSTKLVKTGGTMVAKPVNVRSSIGVWKPVQNVTGMFYLTPDTDSYANGATVTLVLCVNSLTTPVNSLQANLTYDGAKLQFVSSDVSASPFESSVQNTGGSGSVQIGLVSLDGTVVGDQVISTLKFTAIGTGATAITYASGCGLARASDSTNVLNQTLGATLTIS